MSDDKTLKQRLADLGVRAGAGAGATAIVTGAALPAAAVALGAATSREDNFVYKAGDGFVRAKEGVGFLLDNYLVISIRNRNHLYNISKILKRNARFITKSTQIRIATYLKHADDLAKDPLSSCWVINRLKIKDLQA